MSSPTKRLKTEEESVPFKPMSKKPLQYKQLAKCGYARRSIVTLPHGQVDTPIFMPVGTKGTIKGLTSEEMEDLHCYILLSNTYHLESKPSSQYIADFGGLHKFMNWKRNILTDSGGFQMVSLSKLCEVTEEGVRFEHPSTKEMLFLRPEDSIKAQNNIGSDIMMALDDVVQTTTVGPRMGEACERTIRWIDRNISAHQKQDVQNLFPIIQGGIDPKLRERCLSALVAKDANGYAIGGLSGGEEKERFFDTVLQSSQGLPENKPRYLMGVGYPVDILLCSLLGVDMFDCVYPTRTARFGTAFTRYGNLKLANAKNKFDFTPVEEGCKCETCQTYTKAYLHSVATREEVAGHLLSKHNIHFNLNLMRRVQQAISEGNTKALAE